MLYHRFGHQSLFTLQTCRAAAFHGPGAVSSSCVRMVAHTSLSPLVTLTSLHPTHGTRLALSLLPTASWAREEISGFRTGKTPAGWTLMVIYRFPALLHTPAVNRPHCIPIPFFFSMPRGTENKFQDGLVLLDAWLLQYGLPCAHREPWKPRPTHCLKRGHFRASF